MCRCATTVYGSWTRPGARPDNTDEVILVGRLSVPPGPAEKVTKDFASPSRLWLRRFACTRGQAPELDGAMRQETFVRIFIPVQPK